MFDVANSAMAVTQDVDKCIAIMPAQGLLQSGYFKNEGVLFIHSDSFKNIEPLLAFASESVSDNITSEFAMAFSPIFEELEEIFIKNSLAIFVFDKDDFELSTRLKVILGYSPLFSWNLLSKVP